MMVIEMRRYFGFLFSKRGKIRFAIFALSTAIMIGLSYASGLSWGKWESVEGGYRYVVDILTASPYIFSFVLLGLCFIEPALIFSFKMKRNSFETERRLSVSKRSMYFARYIMGYLEIILPYTFAYFISAGFLFINRGYWDSFYLASFFYVVLHVGGIFAYSFFTFFYLRGRNIIDGFVLMVLATLAIMFLGNAILYLGNMAGGALMGSFEYRVNPFSMFQWACIYLDDALNHKSTLDNITKIFGMVSTGLFSLSIFGIVLHKGDFNCEHANQKTVSYFGYKTLIPLTFIPLMVFKNVIGLPIYYIFFVLVFSLTYLAYALSYRRFMFTKREWQLYFIIIGAEAFVYFLTLFL
jgi:hypothetical protein